MNNSAFSEDDEKGFEIQQNGKNNKSSEPLTHTFEEAIRLTGSGKFHFQLLWTAGLCFLSVMSQILCPGVILPAVKCDLAATLQEQGLLGSAGFFGIVCSSHAMGFLGDTWGRKCTLRWSLILSTISATISAFSVNIWMLIVTRFLTGVFSAGCQACVFSFCSEFHSDLTRARHITLISSFLSLAVVYVPVEAILILPLHINFTIFGMVMSPWRIMLLAVNISPIMALILLYFTPETPKYELVHGNHDGALNTLRHVFSRNTGRPMEEYPVKNIQLETSGANIADIHSVKDAVKMVWTQTIPIFYKERILHTLNICVILSITYGLPHGVFMWIPTILNDEINRPDENVCLVISEVDVLGDENSNICSGQVDTLTYWIMILIGACAVVLYLVFAYTINIIGSKNLLIFWLFAGGLSTFAIPYVSNLAISVLTLFLVCSVSNCGGMVSTIAVEFYPTNINAMAMCFVMMVGRLGAVAGNNFLGFFLFDYCAWTFRGIGITLLATAFLIWLLPQKKREK